MPDKPPCQLTGQNGNVYSLIAIASRALKRDGQRDKAEEMRKRITEKAQSYDEALTIIMEYVEVS